MLGTLKRVGWLVGPAREMERERETAMENENIRAASRAASGPCRDDARVLRPTMVGPHMILVSCPDHRSRSWR